MLGVEALIGYKDLHASDVSANFSMVSLAASLWVY